MWLVLGPALLGIASLGYLLVRRVWLDGKRKPVPGYAGLLCEGEAPERVAQHVALALKWMTVAFPGRVLSPPLAGWTVVVMATGSWTRVRRDGTTGPVAGFLDTLAQRIEVAPDMDGLAHELAHLLETHFTGRTDSKHESWHDNGIYVAISGYQTERPKLHA